jgi:RNA polymerase sigma factor (sigma-70 family)
MGVQQRRHVHRLSAMRGGMGSLAGSQMVFVAGSEFPQETVRAQMTARAFESDFRAAFSSRFAELFRVLDRYLGDESLAADIAQETFVRLYRRGEMPDDLRAWLVSVALNQARDELRRRSRRLRLLQRHVNEEPTADTAPSPEDELLSAERRSMVRRALDALAPRERALLLMREEGYSYRELAIALQLTGTSVGTLLARARIAFRQAYESMQQITPEERKDANP